MSALDTARGYIRRGWSPVPIPHQKKGPVIKGWPSLRIGSDEARQFFNGAPQNVGIILGEASGHLVDADLDCAEAVTLAGYFLPPTEAVFGREGKPRSHWLYIADVPKSLEMIDPDNGECMLELRSASLQTMFPGSTHPTGEPVEWVDDGDPAPVDPARLQTAVKRLAAACLLLRHDPQKGRHYFFRAVSGWLLRNGWKPEAVRHFLLPIMRIKLADREKQAEDELRRMTEPAENAELPGFPKLIEHIGEKRARKLAEWLEVRLEVKSEAPQEPAPEQPAQDKPSALDIESFNAKLLVGTVPPIEWLIDGSFRRGELGLLAAMGAAGKSFLLLWLALNVIRPKGNYEFQNPIFGGAVAATGSVVLVCAEDSKNEIWRRLEALDPGGRIREASPHNLYIVSVPDMGKPLFIVRTKGREIALDNGLDFIADFMGSVPDLAMVGIDPIQPLVGADLNVSAEAVQVAFNALAALAAKHRAAVIVAHHMRKNGAKDITSAEEAREAIRGSGDIVNRPRLSYALWPASKEDANKVIKALELKPRRGLVFHGAIVKANGVHNSDAQVYVRDAKGLLLDRTACVRATRVAPKQITEDFIRGVAEAAELGRPFMRGGAAGVFVRRDELPESVRGMSRGRLEGLVDELLDAKRLTRGIYDGTIPKWLDIPGGPFDLGTGSFAVGAPTGKSGPKSGRDA